MMNRWVNELRIIKHYMVIPLISIVVIMPLVVFGEIGRKAVTDISEKEYILQRYMDLFYPLFMLLFFVLCFYSFIEGEGRELLYLKGRLKIIEAGIPLVVLMGLMICTAFIQYRTMVENLPVFLVKNVVVLLTFWGLCYFLAYFFSHMTAVTVIVLILYLLFLAKPAGILSGLYDLVGSKYTIAATLYAMRGWLLADGLLFFVGIFCNKRYQEF